MISEVKQAVNGVMEAKRKSGDIGGSLQAKVTLFCQEALAEQLKSLGDELRFVLICSATEVSDTGSAGEATEVEGLSVLVEKSGGEKCERCWHFRTDVGEHEEHPTLCGRCVHQCQWRG